MTYHYPDLGTTSDWLNQKHYPDLGSDVSSVWNFFTRSQTSFGGETSGSVAKCPLFSQAIKIMDKNTNICN